MLCPERIGQAGGCFTTSFFRTRAPDPQQKLQWLCLAEAAAAARPTRPGLCAIPFIPTETTTWTCAATTSPRCATLRARTCAPTRLRFAGDRERTPTYTSTTPCPLACANERVLDRARALPEVQAQFNTPQFETQTTTKTGNRLKRPPRMAQVHALCWWAPPGSGNCNVFG